METRIAQQDLGSWPRHLKHRYHEDEKLKTTLCYLTLAPRVVSAKCFQTSEMEMEIGMASYSTAQAVTIPSKVRSGLRESDTLKFRRAMNVLGLKPYLHPSQRGNLKAAKKDVAKKDVAKTEVAKTTSKTSTTKSKAKCTATSSIPFLTLLIP